LPEEFKITVWSRLRPYYMELERRNIASKEELEKWLLDWNELSAFVEEEYGWRYIKLTLDVEDKKAVDYYQYFIRELSPKIALFVNRLNEKLMASRFVESLDRDKYFILIRALKNDLALFRKENVTLLSDQQMKSKEYGEVFSKITVEVDGKEMTVQQAMSLLENTNRTFREEVYKKAWRSVIARKDRFEEIFDDLKTIRQKIAKNAGFENYRDYKFQAMGRFDYTVQDCLNFHDGIEKEIIPIIDTLNLERKKALGVDELRPWDMQVDIYGSQVKKITKDADELIEKSIRCLESIDPFFGECIAVMKEMGHLDLDSRQGKHPGGYNMPLYFTGVPFIFMNATGNFMDIRTLLHESGHAVHSFLTRNMDLIANKSLPSEVAELASMTMELISMEYWGVFFDDKEELRKAKIKQLEGALKTLSWVATIDSFQHWLYTHPNHSQEERKDAWVSTVKRFESKVLNTNGLGDIVAGMWYRQLHIFEVPFYYIEYGMAQLGAIAIWKNYLEAPKEALQNYINALKLGYSKPIGEIYKTAGIEFNFEAGYIRELATFVLAELDKLKRG